MLPYLTQSEIRLHAEEIRKEFEQLLRLAVKTHARQWDFFRHCFNVVMDNASGNFNCDKSQATDYIHEISSKLRDYYSRRHNYSIRFKFKVEDVRHKGRLLGKDTYHTCNEYLLLIIPTDPNLNTIQQTKNILCRAIDDAIHAEFRTYYNLPEKNLSPLDNYFDLTGKAYKRIVDGIEEHQRYKEVISNPSNPSTRPQLRRVEIKELDEQTATVKAVEYWNLHWFSTVHHVYVKPYYGQNQQCYILIKHNDRWLVQENQYRLPRKMT